MLTPQDFMKRELAQVLTKETARITNVKEASTFVVIAEVKKENWAVGGKLMVDKYPD